MRAITALFDTYDHAAAAVRSLKDAGIPDADISMVANNADGKVTEIHEEDHTDAATGAGLGVATGAGVGLLAGLGSLAIPGIGPVVATGWLLSTAVGAAIGAASGGILGALMDAGVSEDDAHIYAEGVRRGGTLVTARVDDSRANSAEAILRASNGVDIGKRRQEYATQGWERFDETADPVVTSAPPVSPVGMSRI